MAIGHKANPFDRRSNIRRKTFFEITRPYRNARLTVWKVKRHTGFPKLTQQDKRLWDLLDLEVYDDALL
jgi:hypothetical protein